VSEIAGIHYQTGEPIVLTVEEGKIASIQTLPSARSCTDGSIAFIAPGLVDLQINGYNGLDLNLFPLETACVHGIVRELWKEGVTSFFPTVTTNTDDRIGEAMATIAKACGEDETTAAAIAGIHLEGPFISPEDGPRGAQKLEYVKPPDWDLFQHWQEAAGGRIKIITLSPEWREAQDFISKCADSGVIVSIGHTAASPEQIREAVAAGARMSTHFGNGAHLTLPRHPNYLWEQLAQDQLWASMIADGFHLPESFLKVVMAVKPDRTILVSDAVHLSGMPSGEYYSHNRVHVVKTPEGRLHMAEQPNLLAGSAQMLPWGIGHLVRKRLCHLAKAWDMASVRPSTLMNLPSRHGLSAGSPADVVLFSWKDCKINILRTYKQGRLCYSIEA
jgi:N-acetylglucosamine-6-phosphate deacetylase